MAPLFFLLMLSFLSLSEAQIASHCFEAGSCVDSQFLGFTNAIDSNHCLFDCQANNATSNRCEWFTYYPDDGYCLQFYNCTTQQVTSDCPKCVSGENECRPVYECELTNTQCQAVVIDSTISFGSSDCLNFCKETDGCEWYTFNTDDGACVAFSDCMNRVNCPSCISGENDCEPPTNILFEKLFVVGGAGVNSTREVEVLDLNGRYNCSQPADLPVGLAGSSGIYLNNRILICGGQLANSTVVNTCYTYNSTTNVWRQETFRLREPRANMASVQVNDDMWWLTGGTNDASFYSTTELFHAHNNSFTVGPNLPRPLAYHCISQIDAQRFMVTGGASIGSLTTSAVYDFARHQWETKAALPQGRYGHFCGTVVTPGTGSIWNIDVVDAAGSQTSTHVYSTRSNTWTTGVNHPLNTAFGSSVAYGHSFITLGGDSGDMNLYIYNASVASRWTDMRLRVKFPRQDSAAFLIPNEAYRCDGEEDTTA